MIDPGRIMFFEDGAAALRVPYGDEPAHVRMTFACPDCGSLTGTVHARGCRREQCPRAHHDFPRSAALCGCTPVDRAPVLEDGQEVELGEADDVLVLR